MRIVHIGTGVVPVLPFGSRGPEKTIYYSTKHLARLGHKVEVIDVKQGAHDRDATEARFHEVGFPSVFNSNLFSYFRIMIFSLISGLIIRRLIREKGVDVVHAHSQFPAAAVLLARWVLRWNITLIYTAHNPYLVMPCTFVERLKHTIIEGPVLMHVDCVVSQTESVSRELQRKYRIEPSRTIPISAGIDIDAISNYLADQPVKKNDSPLILYAAIINPRKNQMALLQAVPKVIREYPNAKFIFPGAIDDVEYFDQMNQFIDEHKLSENAIFTGDLSTHELYQVYRDATMFVFPTRYETQGVVLLEAMAFSLPVIASDIGPIRDIVEMERDSALLIDSSEIEEISQSIIRVLENESLRMELSLKGKKLAHNTFSWDQVAGRTASAYHEFIRAKELNTVEVVNNG